MSKGNQKSKEMRNNINERMQNFYIGNNTNPEPKVFDTNNLDSDYYNYKPAGPEEKFQSIQRSDFKNDINERLNIINDMTVDNMRRLPLNNNIRDSQITTGSKRDQFNERLSNYSLLSSNMVASPHQIIDNKNTGFHTNFKEDHNDRLQELSPLSRNMAIPMSKEPVNQKQVMEQIQTGIPPESYGIQSYSSGMDTYEFLDDVGNLQVNEMMPMDSRQKFNFKE
jgi:hypothetical protein